VDDRFTFAMLMARIAVAMIVTTVKTASFTSGPTRLLT
jgi:hypothetical protein